MNMDLYQLLDISICCFFRKVYLWRLYKIPTFEQFALSTLNYVFITKLHKQIFPYKSSNMGSWVPGTWHKFIIIPYKKTDCTWAFKAKIPFHFWLFVSPSFYLSLSFIFCCRWKYWLVECGFKWYWTNFSINFGLWTCQDTSWAFLDYNYVWAWFHFLQVCVSTFFGSLDYITAEIINQKLPQFTAFFTLICANI